MVHNHHHCPQLDTFVELVDNSGILLKVGIGGDDLGDDSPGGLLLPHRDHLLQRLDHRWCVVVLVENDNIDSRSAGESWGAAINSFNLVGDDNKKVFKV